MTNVGTQIDAEQPAAFRGPTEIKAEKKRVEVLCAMCGHTISVDEDMYNFAKEGIESGLDNPFKCEACEEEYDLLSYEG